MITMGLGIIWCFVIRVCKCNHVPRDMEIAGSNFHSVWFSSVIFLIDMIYRQEELLWYNANQKILVLFLISRHLSNCEIKISIFPWITVKYKHTKFLTFFPGVFHRNRLNAPTVILIYLRNQGFEKTPSTIPFCILLTHHFIPCS